jgi:hypothetical protein
VATASVTYSFAPNTTILSAQVNTNFEDIVDFLNNSVMHRDAAVAFTNVPSGPASDPSSDNQLTRKAYVDALVGERPRLISYTTSTSAPSLSTSYTTIPNTAISHNFTNGRRYLFWAAATLNLTGSGTGYLMRVTDGSGNTIGQIAQDNGATAARGSGFVIVNNLSGSKTVSLQARTISGSGSVSGGSEAPSQLLLFDFGPTS